MQMTLASSMHTSFSTKEVHMLEATSLRVECSNNHRNRSQSFMMYPDVKNTNERGRCICIDKYNLFTFARKYIFPYKFYLKYAVY